MSPPAAGEDLPDRVRRALETRWPESRMAPSLDRIRALLDLLGDPHRGLACVHITGTNGKTSTARMVDSLLRQFGLRVGRYTSPHLQRISERISLDGEPLRADRFTAAYDELAPYLTVVDKAAEHPLSFFEVLTGLAFAVFADAPVDAAVVEVGLGGRWDATNVVDAPVAVITPIGLDHMAYLGDTLEQIAGEKAGIIKPGAVAVLAGQPPPAAAVLDRQAAAVGARVLHEHLDFAVADRRLAVGGQLLTLTAPGSRYPEVFLPLHGSHQAGNAAGALTAVQAFLGGRPLDPARVRAGFAEVSSPGRLEVLHRSPTVLLDGAHNPAGAAALAAALREEFSFPRLVGLVGVLADKDVVGLLTELRPVLHTVVATQSSSPRALPAAELAEVAAGLFGDERVVQRPRLADALELALRLAGDPPGPAALLVTGSIVTVGEARSLLLTGRPG